MWNILDTCRLEAFSGPLHRARLLKAQDWPGRLKEHHRRTTLYYTDSLLYLHLYQCQCIYIIYATNVYSWQHSETFVRILRLSQMLCLQRNSPGEIRVGSNVWSRRSGQRLSMESEHEVVLRSTSSWMCCIWMWCTYTCLSVAIDKKYMKIIKNTCKKIHKNTTKYNIQHMFSKWTWVKDSETRNQFMLNSTSG